MASVVLEFAGEVREASLAFGDLLDIEEACGKVGIGAIYLRLSRHEYHVRHVREVLAFALRGADLSLHEARRLVDERLEVDGLVRLHAMAIDVLVALMSGIEPDEGGGEGDPAQPMDAGGIFAAFGQIGISPSQVREMRYADFVAMARAMGGDQVKPPTEDEFHDMVRRYEARQKAGSARA